MEAFVDKFISTAQRVDIQREKCAASSKRLCGLILQGAASGEIADSHKECEVAIINLTVAEIARGVAARELEKAGALGRVLAERMAV